MRHWKAIPAALAVIATASGCSPAPIGSGLRTLSFEPNSFGTASFGTVWTIGQVLVNAVSAKPARKAQPPSDNNSWAQNPDFEAGWETIIPASASSGATTVKEFSLKSARAAEIVDNVLAVDPNKLAGRKSANDATAELAVVDGDGSAATNVIELVKSFQTIAVTWPTNERAPRVQVRVRDNAGRWSRWVVLKDDGAEPDLGQQDKSALRAGSDTIYVGEVNAFQVATIGKADHAVPSDSAKIAVISTDESAARAAVVSAAFLPSQSAEFQFAAQAPRIFTRAEWGAADPRCTWPSADAVANVIVHHTAGSNNYSTQADAMQQIRNDQAYHQRSRGWCDIAYNFLVDKWGNIYEGAAGSMESPVIGAHTAGFNTGSVGISILGNYDKVQPSGQVVDSIGRIAAWRLKPYGVDPRSQVDLLVHGVNTKGFKNGTTITVPAISGHRDLGSTICPGAAAYQQMEAIRAAAAKAVGGPAPKPQPTPAPAQKPPAQKAPAPVAAQPPAAPPAGASKGRDWLTVNEMKKVQQGLNRMFPTYSRLQIDGDLGPSTRAVLKEFQRRNSLPITGIPDVATQAALARYKIVF